MHYSRRALGMKGTDEGKPRTHSGNKGGTRRTRSAAQRQQEDTGAGETAQVTYVLSRVINSGMVLKDFDQGWAKIKGK